MDGRGEVGEIVCVGDTIQVEGRVDGLELVEAGGDEPDRGSGCREASDPIRKQ